MYVCMCVCAYVCVYISSAGKAPVSATNIITYLNNFSFNLAII